MQEVRSGDVQITDTDQQQLVLVAEEELVLTTTAASVLARLVRAYLDARQAAA